MAFRVRNTKVTSSGDINQLTFNEKAFGLRITPVGGVFDILGTATTALEVGKRASLMFANNSASAAFVKFGTSAVAAPTGIADGLFLPPNSITYFGSGDLTHVRTSAATVGVYRMQEDIVIIEDNYPT